MIFSNETRINPEAVKDSIPIIHGQNYYIDDDGSASTFNVTPEKVFDSLNKDIEVASLQQVTEFIYIINQKLAYKTDSGILVTDVDAVKTKYRGGFQGIAGFNEAETSYQYINNNEPLTTQVTFTGRLSASKKLQLQIDENTWVTPLGEFRCYISGTFYNINYNTILPNTFGETFTVQLAGWTNVEITPDTNYINDLLVSGNTLYLSTRLNIIGTEPYNWSHTDTESSTVLWSEDSRLTGSYFQGSPTATYFYLVNYNTSSIYYLDASDLSILQEYQHNLPILGTGNIDKFAIGIVDKETITILRATASLNTWFLKGKFYQKFNQLSAYEEMFSQYLKEEVVYCQDLKSLVISSTQRTPMILYVSGDKVVSGCHTQVDIIPGDYSSYLIKDKKLYRYCRVEDSGEYDEIDIANGIVNFDSFIYIGSDLEPDLGGSTMKDTEIMYEGKIAIVEGDEVSVESSTDLPIDTSDLPIRTLQDKPENWWYLYTKTLRYPISYTDWIKISMMPTTKIFNIRLVEPETQQKAK